MRRKSRILLCFAVLWVLGIAYYFYSGTSLSRKVRVFRRLRCCIGLRGVVPAAARLFSYPDKATRSGGEGFGAAVPLCSPGLRFCGCTDAERNVIKGPASISGQALIW